MVRFFIRRLWAVLPVLLVVSLVVFFMLRLAPGEAEARERIGAEARDHERHQHRADHHRHRPDRHV